MPDRELQCLLISDFNIDLLAAHLRNRVTDRPSRVTVAPFGQVLPTLMNGELDLWQREYEVGVIWTRPEGIFPSFQQMLEFHPPNLDQILEEVDALADLLIPVSRRFRHLFLPTWNVPSLFRGYGILEMRNGHGIANTVARMNLRLADRLADCPGIYLLDSASWIARLGRQSFSPKLWYMGKVPFAHEIFKEAADEIVRCLDALAGNARKLVVVDLDETLWGGILGEVGADGIRLGGHDPLGEAFVDFQRALLSLTRRGILLGIASKNEESLALDAIRNHPEMVLRPESFAGWRINWQDKAANIADLVQELNLGLQSVVFIDDNPAERGRVAEALPEVLVPDWPEDKMLYRQALLSLSCFDAPVLSAEDAARTRMYQEERKRRQERARVGSLTDWLRSLEVRARIEALRPENFQRALQLLNKTNQMNLSTRRLSEGELKDWAGRADHEIWTVRVSDRFGDSGLTGLVSMEWSDADARIVDFILSCRVFGRNIERAMVRQACERARALGLRTLRARFIPTERNAPCLAFWKDSGFDHEPSTNCFSWNLEQAYPAPEHVTVVCESGDESALLSPRSKE